MRILQFILSTIVIQASLAQAHIIDDPSATELIAIEGAEIGPLFNTGNSWAASARTRALEILDKAISIDKKNPILKETYAALKKATIEMPPTGWDYKTCEGGRKVAFVLTKNTRPVIYLCSRLYYDGYNDDALAQMLIHEGAHVAGYFYECRATLVEIRAMELSGVGVQFISDYWEPCGFDPKK